MADITITASAVIAASGAAKDPSRTAGTTITAGQAVYVDSSNTWQLSDANSAAAAKTVGGISLHAALAGQPLSVITGGTLGLGAILTAGHIYVLSGTAGGIAPHADLASGMTTCIIGVATSTSNLAININNSGAAIS